MKTVYLFLFMASSIFSISCSSNANQVKNMDNLKSNETIENSTNNMEKEGIYAKIKQVGRYNYFT